MRLRGPDGSGVWLEPANLAGLGHRRLAIIDLSPEAGQPMRNEDGAIVITFNGEIYNHAEIRRELEELGGHVWRTSHSDTEVIIHAYEQWGMACLEKFRGMFAFALWDARSREMILVRDRIGIKPLYYTEYNGVLTFASEIKALLKVCPRKPEINTRAMYDYLSFLTTPAEETLFEHIRKLRPGAYARVKNGVTSVARYWDLWDHTRPEFYNASEEEIKEALLAELRISVRLRKEADVPVGIFLSGGIDSSTNAALFSEGEHNAVKAFCIGYDQDYSSYKNETGYARRAAEFCGADYRERLLALEDVLDFVPEMVRLQDEPIGDPICVPVYYVSKLARDNGIIVAQVGEGSDELFWGYGEWKSILNLSEANNIPFPNILKKAGLYFAQAAGLTGKRYYEYLRRAVQKQPVFWSGAEAFYEEDKRRLLSPDVRKELSGYTSFEAIRPTWNNFKEKAWEKSHLNWMSYADLSHRLPELLLMRVDKMSMGVSLECRVPFLDHKFVELAMSIPQRVKTRSNISKYILKETVRGVIPDEIIDRPKQGFGVPLQDWFTGRLGNEMLVATLEFAGETGLLNTEYIKKLHANPEYGYKFWYLYNLAAWWKTYIARA
jgi:asparagine synthase (glutamine-hydrolysing)